MSEHTGSESGVLGKIIEILSTDGVVLAVAGAAIAFIFKLLGDYIAEKNRQATNVRVLATYIDLAIENWDQQKIAAVPGSPSEFRMANYDEIEARTTQYPNINGAGGERYTPFVPFSPHDDLTIDEVRDLIGFLDQREIEAVIRFVETEGLTHAIAKDFRSEYVRRAWTQERKLKLFVIFNRTLAEARCAAAHARDALAPFKECPIYFWFVPFGLRLRRHCHLDPDRLSFRQCQRKNPGKDPPCRCFGDGKNKR